MLHFNPRKFTHFDSNLIDKILRPKHFITQQF